jgi:hypothetical protein
LLWNLPATTSLVVSASFYLPAALIEETALIHRVRRIFEPRAIFRRFAIGFFFVLLVSRLHALVVTRSTLCFPHQPCSSAYSAPRLPSVSDMGTSSVPLARMSGWETHSPRHGCALCERAGRGGWRYASGSCRSSGGDPIRVTRSERSRFSMTQVSG